MNIHIKIVFRKDVTDDKIPGMEEFQTETMNNHFYC